MHANQAETTGTVRPEDLAAQYASRWVIYRDLCPDGTCDEWVAEPRHAARDMRTKITADDIDALAEQLAQAEVIAMAGVELQAMQERWGSQWCIWRSRDDDGCPRSWCATRCGEGRELSMTLVEPTAAELEKALVRQAESPVVYG